MPRGCPANVLFRRTFSQCQYCRPLAAYREALGTTWRCDWGAGPVGFFETVAGCATPSGGGGVVNRIFERPVRLKIEPPWQGPYQTVSTLSDTPGTSLKGQYGRASVRRVTT